ncbi:hypothetical protein A0O28_0032040 [Trichoderma guizhouense]|uniref:Uncharacterized protein n=1 Tax=Trichoderma guizhouense TaxID=1491466 RepID=A0A1T3CLX8_9HYPO|nr:hypothetical protein A0O28_0032040 [Trichoderma guizhouense]
MLSRPVLKYHIATNFSIPPVEAGGILQLGSIIANVASADEPLNDDCHVQIPQDKLFCSHQKGFTAIKSHMTRGDYGVWAKFVGLVGLGGELGWASKRSTEDIYYFRSIDTIYFNPSQAYMNDSMHQNDIKDYLVGSGEDHVYMVTGLKIARGPSVKMAETRRFQAAGNLGLQEPGGSSFELGPKFGISKEMRQEAGFEDSTDFIIGIRVRKLMYKKHWLTRTSGALLAKEYNKGATMVDDDAARNGADEAVDLGDDGMEAQTEVETETIDSKITQTVWVIS